MSDLYVHHHLECTKEQYRNLFTLVRYLVRNADSLDARQGLQFGYTGSMRRIRPLPAKIVANSPPSLPPLAYGPHAGVAPREDDDWKTYCVKSFGVRFEQPFIHWVQDEKWQTTEPSALGAGLRIAYVLDYGVPHDYLAIAYGQASTDYDTNGFLWDKLDMVPTNLENGDFKPLRKWPDDGKP